jgi:hypothetical protein
MRRQIYTGRLQLPSIYNRKRQGRSCWQPLGNGSSTHVAFPEWWRGFLLSWATWVCIGKMFSQIAIFLPWLGQPPISSWASPLICQCYIRPGAGPNTMCPKCSLSCARVCERVHTCNAKWASPLFDMGRLSVSANSQGVIPRPAFCACFVAHTGRIVVP